jgi:hypothetical protein
VDVFRRGVQRAFLEAVDAQLNPPRPTTAQQQQQVQQQRQMLGDARALLRGELSELRTLAGRAAERTNDRMTRLHLRDVQMEIDRILEPADR